MEIDPIDQMVIMDALRQFAEGCRYRAEAHREYGSTVVAQTRDVMASTAERLYKAIAEADRMVIS